MCFKFLYQEGNAFRATSPVTDGILDSDFFGSRSVFEENLNRVGDGAFLWIKIILRVTGILDADHLVGEPFDARIAGDIIFVVIRREFAEDQSDGGHVLNTVIAVRWIMQRSGFVDDSDRRLLGNDRDPFN